MKILQAQRKILITGGSGYIGSVLVNYLLKKNLSVRVIDILPFSGHIPQQYKKKFEYIQSDIRKIKSTLFKNIFAIIHLAAFSNETSSDKNPNETKRINTLAAIALAQKAKELNVKRFIFASSSSIYDKGMDKEDGPKSENTQVSPTGAYSITKYEAEKELLTFSDKKFSVVIFRKATVCGFSPVMRFDLVVNAMVKSALTNGHIRVYCKGLQWRPLISVSDVSQAYYRILTAPKQNVAGQIFNIGLNNFRVRDIASLIQETIKKYFYINPKIIFEQNDRKDRSYRIGTKKAKDIFGFTAKITIEKTIIDLVKKLF
ncbi:MAG: hypothetical protein A3H79_01035 [Candidatus Levybacteria bacterium RIFCSPLOWO2_02_FULL_36_8b]|nr:MAG: hypothetical protein A3H79_01035 [Candidatus Levybacteria bacterium RIFCSPLOWO2_02_FULL_36_8b]